jgi:hypothetical protein
VRLATLALALGLSVALPATSGAAVKSGIDRHADMRLTLDGRILTAEIVHRNQTTEEQLYGKRIDGICSAGFQLSRHQFVIRRQLWPAGARRVSFVFKRDISRRVKWCLIEYDAGDIAFVSLIEAERPMFVGKGRGPSGHWWRLAGWRGPAAEPCALLRREGGFSFRPCFHEFIDRRVTLGVRQVAGCDDDAFVFGVVSRAAAAVRVQLADGSTVDAKLYDKPRGSRVRARYFAVALPERTVVSFVRSFDAGGAPLARHSLEDEVGSSCPP